MLNEILLLAVPVRPDVLRELRELAAATEGFAGDLGAFVADLVRVFVAQATGRNLPADPAPAPQPVQDAPRSVLTPNGVPGKEQAPPPAQTALQPQQPTGRVLDLDDAPAPDLYAGTGIEGARNLEMDEASGPKPLPAAKILTPTPRVVNLVSTIDAPTATPKAKIAVPKIEVTYSDPGIPRYCDEAGHGIVAQRYQRDGAEFHVVNRGADFVGLYTATGQHIATMERGETTWVRRGGGGVGSLWRLLDDATGEWLDAHPPAVPAVEPVTVQPATPETTLHPVPPPPEPEAGDDLGGLACGPVVLPTNLVWAMHLDGLDESLLPSAKAFRGQRLPVDDGPIELTQGDVLLFGHGAGTVTLQIVTESLGLVRLGAQAPAKGWGAQMAGPARAALAAIQE